jgi:hypothetical protein
MAEDHIPIVCALMAIVFLGARMRPLAILAAVLGLVFLLLPPIPQWIHYLHPHIWEYSDRNRRRRTKSTPPTFHLPPEPLLVSSPSITQPSGSASPNPGHDTAVGGALQSNTTTVAVPPATPPNDCSGWGLTDYVADYTGGRPLRYNDLGRGINPQKLTNQRMRDDWSSAHLTLKPADDHPRPDTTAARTQSTFPCRAHRSLFHLS